EDFVEKHLTTGRFAECDSLATASREVATEKQARLVLSSIEFACLTGEQKPEAAQAVGRRLRKEMSGLLKGSWSFGGTEHFFSGHPAFAAKATQWVSLFDALEQGDEKKGMAALTGLGVPEIEQAQSK